MEFSVYGPYRGCTGYDAVVRAFLKEWYHQGHNVQIFEFKNWSNLRGSTDMDDILAEMESNSISNPQFHINFCLLDQAMINPNTTNIVYTMFESDRICQQWVESSKFIDLVMVPTEFNRETFVKSGIPEYKVKVCPVPLDIMKIQEAKTLNLKSYTGEDMSQYKNIFLNVSEFIDRKNVEGLISCWCDETRGNKDSCLILKLCSNSGVKLDFLKQRIESITRIRKDAAPVYLLIQNLSDEHMVNLCNSCTHYYSMSFGEGWGMSETISGVLGKKLVVPESSAFSEYANKDTAYTIKTQSIGTSQSGFVARYYAGGNWFAPVQFFAKKALRSSMDDHRAGITDKEKNLQKLLVDKCDSFKVANKFLNTIDKYVPVKTVKPFDISEGGDNFNWAMFCKTLNTKCGIADYTSALCAGIVNDTNTGRYKGYVVISGEPYSYNHFFDDSNNDIQIAHMQLEYQFASPSRLKSFITFVEKSGAIPIITMHTVNVSAYDYHKVLIDTRCPIIVSSQKMKDTLLANGFSPNHNIKVIPMGVSNEFVNSSISPKNSKFRIGFFGFTYFHKGIDRILQYMYKFGADKECLIMSTKPENDRGYFDKMQRFFEHSNKLGNSLWVSEFLNEEDIVHNLNTCDLIFLPYSEYGGIGVSAAVRTCLKAGVPIVSFNNSFFDDIVHESELIKFISDDPNDFEKWSFNLNNYIELLKKAEVKPEYIEKRNKFVEKYNWVKIGGMHLDHYKSLLAESGQR